jgi:hypothetical protein
MNETSVCACHTLRKYRVFSLVSKERYFYLPIIYHEGHEYSHI